jgi:hypothetical protein
MGLKQYIEKIYANYRTISTKRKSHNYQEE